MAETPTPPTPDTGGRLKRTLLVWCFVLGAFIGLYRLLEPARDLRRFDAFLALAEEGKVATVDVEVRDGIGRGRAQLRSGEHLSIEDWPAEAYAAASSFGVIVRFRDSGSLWATTLLSILPSLVIVVLLGLVYRSMKNPRTPASMQFTPVFEPVTSAPSTTQTAARDRLAKVFGDAKAGRPGPRRLLVTGPTGSGKTRLVQAALAATALPASMHPGSRFVELYVGVGAERIRALFRAAAAQPAAAIVIKDIDAFGATRVTPDVDGRVFETTQTLLALANELDGTQPLAAGTVFIATTNRPDLLDPALTRPGRVDLCLTLDAAGNATLEETPIGGST